jgi:hypothetical protein
MNFGAMPCREVPMRGNNAIAEREKQRRIRRDHFSFPNVISFRCLLNKKISWMDYEGFIKKLFLHKCKLGILKTLAFNLALLFRAGKDQDKSCVCPMTQFFLPSLRKQEPVALS